MIFSYHRVGGEVLLKVKELSGKKIISISFRRFGTTIKIILKEKNIFSSSVIHFR